MRSAAMENPRNRQEELGQFLTATPVADFMASMFGSLSSTTRNASKDRTWLLVKAIIEVFCARGAGQICSKPDDFFYSRIFLLTGYMGTHIPAPYEDHPTTRTYR
ncbi:MAG: hypothetical protein K9N23_20375 [Akkermansiaceae bacterium]|nr:hypothetical protein [Akkermansiaceae bacterium]